MTINPTAIKNKHQNIQVKNKIKYDYKRNNCSLVNSQAMFKKSF